MLEPLNTSKFKRSVAIASLFLAFIHFSLEMTYTVAFGQSFLGLLPDLIADALLVFGSYLLLKDVRLTGVICGAWGFTLCLHYRAWAWRYEASANGTIVEAEGGVMLVLASSMIISIVFFLLTIVINTVRQVGTTPN